MSNSSIGSRDEGSSTHQLSGSIVRVIFLLLGVGILMPWNAFVSAKPYFQSRLCSDDGQVIVDFELWFGLIWNLSSVLSLGLIILSTIVSDILKKRNRDNTILLSPDASGTPSNDPGSEQICGDSSEGHSFWLVMVPLALYMAVFLVTDLLVLVPNIPPKTFFAVTVAGLAICGTCGAIAQAGIISTAGLFNSKISINPFFSGQALGGVAVSLANFAAASMENPSSFWEQNCQADNYRIQKIRELDSKPTCAPYAEYDWAVFGYFFAGCFILGSCLAGYSYISKYQRSEHRDDYEVVQDGIPEMDEVSPRTGLELNERVCERDSLDQSESSYQDEPTNESLARQFCEERSHDEIISVDLEEYTEEESEGAVFRAIKGPASCVFLTFAVTLCFFPSWISQLRSSQECETHFRLANDLYSPLSFVVFNLGDLVGRMVSEKIPVDRIQHMSSKLVIASVCRIVFFPLFIFCVTENRNGNRLVVESDLYSLLVQFLFAFTNGILISCAFMHAPRLVAHTTTMQERASEMMTFAVNFGLLSGSMLSFPFSQLASKM